MGRAALLCIVGAVALRLVITGEFGNFVQQHMRIPITLAAVLLIGLGAVEVVGDLRDGAVDPESSRRPVGPTVGWLLGLPIIVLLLVAPAALGAAAADRIDPLVPAEPATNAAAVEPLDDSDGPVPLELYEFISRALWDGSGSLLDAEVELEGLVVNDPDVDDGFRLTKFAVSCCAADGLPLQVMLRGLDTTYENDEWVRVVVQWRPPDDGVIDPEDFVEADVISIEVVDDPPDDPYETPF